MNELGARNAAFAAAFLLIACDGGGGGGTDAGPMMGTDAGPMMGTDAGPMMMGTDAGMPITPDMAALTRRRAADARSDAALCACDAAPFATAAECEAFGRLPARDACEDSAFTANFAGVGAYFTCTAIAIEAYATCIEGASCNEATLSGCGMTAQSALTACESRVEMAAAQAFSDAFGTCVGTNVVGPAGTCPDDTGAVSTTGMAVFMGTTVAAGDDLAPPAGCVTATGGGMSPERALRWTAPADGTYVFDTIGSSFDTVLYLRAGCDAAAMSLGCNDDLSDDDLRSRVSATLTSGQEVLVVVEGFSRTSAGSFVVNINAM
ncbi:MAG: hypothetical protein KF729_19100 [Sandaracinaceae bacterium]|nr:hypothetical protein [Sandaracinaceae bacterium]